MNGTRSISTAYVTDNLQMCGDKTRKNPLFGVVALCARMQASLHTGPMLSINCPILTSLLVPTPTLIIPLNPLHPHM